MPDQTSPAITPASPAENQTLQPTGNGIAVENGATAQSTESNKWFYAKGVEGKGERPTFLEDKYLSVFDQAKAYPEAKKAYAELRAEMDTLKQSTTVPEDYYYNGEYGEYDKEGNFNAPAEIQERLTSFGKMCKDLKISQEAFDTIVKWYESNEKSQQTALQNEYDQQISQELKKLGDNPSERVKKLERWFAHNFGDDVEETIKDMATSARSVEILESIISKIPVTGFAPNNKGVPNADLIASDMEERAHTMLADPNIFVDTQKLGLANDLLKRAKALRK